MTICVYSKANPTPQLPPGTSLSGTHPPVLVCTFPTHTIWRLLLRARRDVRLHTAQHVVLHQRTATTCSMTAQEPGVHNDCEHTELPLRGGVQGRLNMPSSPQPTPENHRVWRLTSVTAQKWETLHGLGGSSGLMQGGWVHKAYLRALNAQTRS